MSQLEIQEGTAQELAPYLAQHPDRRFRLIEVTKAEEKAAMAQLAPALDDRARAAIALLDGWIAEGKAADEQTRMEAIQEVE